MGNTTGRKMAGLNKSKPSMKSFRSSEEDRLKNILIKDPLLPHTRRGEATGGQVDYAKRVSNENIQRSLDAENIQHLLPDVQMAKQLLVSTILSPKDLMSVNLNYQCNSPYLGEVGVMLLRKLEEHMDKDYKIKQKLPDMLRKILFDHGSYPIAILPKSRIDEIINGKHQVGNESYGLMSGESTGRKSLGVLGNNGRYINPVDHGFSLESRRLLRDGFDNRIGRGNLFLGITDNPDALKVKELRAKVQEDNIRNLYKEYSNISLEGTLAVNRPVQTQNTDTPAGSASSVFKSRFYKQQSVLDIGVDKQSDVIDYNDTPMIITYPPESVIPVHVPSNPSEHIGYFIAVDTYGNPVRKTGQGDFFRQAMSTHNGSANGTSQMLDRMRTSLQDYGNVGTDPNTMYQMYAQIVQDEIASRVKNGVHDGDAEVVVPDEVIKMMFARSCSQMYTQLVYIPKDYMTYFAFRYDERGVGTSLLEATKMLSSLRAILLLGNTFGAIKNSINYRKMTIQLSPKDPDPDDTVETALNEFARATQNNLPIMEPNAEVIVGYLQNAGVQVEVKGHPRYPETEIGIDHVQGSNIPINTELSDSLFEDHMHGFGVPPEAIKTSMDVNYATSLIQSNLLFAKNAMIYQEEFSPQLTDHVRKYILANGKLMKELVEIIHNHRAHLRTMGVMDTNSDEEIAVHFANMLELSLPAPDLTQLETQLEAYKVYSDGLDEILPAYISAEIVGSGIGDQLSSLGSSTDEIMANLKAILLREWLADNNVMPRLFDMVGKTSEDKPMLDMLTATGAHREGLVRTIAPFLIQQTKKSKVLADMIEKSGIEPVESSSSESTSSSDDDTGSGDGGGDDSFGGDGGDPFGDDIGSGDDTGGTGDDEDTTKEEGSSDDTSTDTKVEPTKEEPDNSTEDGGFDIDKAEKDAKAETKPEDDEKKKDDETK